MCVCGIGSAGRSRGFRIGTYGLGGRAPPSAVAMVVVVVVGRSGSRPVVGHEDGDGQGHTTRRGGSACVAIDASRSQEEAGRQAGSSGGSSTRPLLGPEDGSASSPCIRVCVCVCVGGVRQVDLLGGPAPKLIRSERRNAGQERRHSIVDAAALPDPGIGSRSKKKTKKEDGHGGGGGCRHTHVQPAGRR